MNQMILERNNSFTTIREKFHHLALLGGAQFAANLRGLRRGLREPSADRSERLGV